MTTSFEKRFWAKVKKTKTCWLWTGARWSNGNPAFWAGAALGTRNARRVSFYLATGAWPGIKEVVRICKTTRCVNPEHSTLAKRGCAVRQTRGFTAEQVHFIRARHNKKTYPVKKLAAKYKVCDDTIYNVLNAKTYTDV